MSQPERVVGSADLRTVPGSLQSADMNGPAGWDADTYDRALQKLQDLVLWRMAPERWDHVDRILRRMDAAMAAGDEDEMREAVRELGLSGPPRILRIGTSGEDGVSETVLERRDTLVHSLTRSSVTRSSVTRPSLTRGEADHGRRAD